MRIFLILLMLAACFGLSHEAVAESSTPARFDDLPKLAVTWPPAWQAMVKAIVPPREDFERDVLDRVAALLGAEPPTTETYRCAESVLAATLRHHLSVRRVAPLAENSSSTLQTELQDRLAKLRKDWLNYLHDIGENDEALKLAARWLPIAPRGNPVRGAILQLWIHQAKDALQKPDYPTARHWLDRIDATFTTATPAEAIRKPLRERAQMLLKESLAQPDAQAIRSLHEALELWPRLPDLRDTLERRRQTYRTLRIAVRSLPDQLSPATAWTAVEKQSLDLLFERLCDLESPSPLGKRYRSHLAVTLPTESTLTASIPLRRDAYWSSGERVTAADLRHTALLMNQPDMMGRTALWRNFLELPRFEGNAFQLNIGYRQGLFDPLAPLTFWILPQYCHGKQLDHADDLEFAKAPVGSGPFQYVGRKQDAGKPVAVFQANAYDVRHQLNSLREIRLTAWSDPRKDLAKPLPHLALDVPTDQITAFKDLGYAEVTVHDSSQVCFLAVNHRRSTLASAPIRRAIAHALDRQGLLERHFRSPSMKGKYHASANGLFPRGSWAAAPAPRVPEELYQPEQARSLARKLPKETGALEWTLKYPDDEAHVKLACEEMARAITAILQEVGIKANVQAQGLSSHALQKAIWQRDYDLLYTSADRLDNPVRLALLFDSSPDASSTGGSNYLGYDSDAKLQQLLNASLQHRQFTVLQENLQAIHVHLYETMPLIPLWQLDMHVMIHPSLRVPALESPRVFAKVQEWKVMP